MPLFTLTCQIVLQIVKYKVFIRHFMMRRMTQSIIVVGHKRMPMSQAEGMSFLLEKFSAKDYGL